MRQSEHKENYLNRTTKVNILINHSFNARSSIRGGVIHSSLWAEMFEDNYLWYRREYEINVDTTGKTSLWQAFLQSKYRFSNHLEMYAGLHSIMLQLNHKYSIEPRISIKYLVNSYQVFTFGSGIHSRMEAIPLYYANVLLPDGTTIMDENNYYCLATLSLFNSKYRLSNGRWYNTNYNSNYISNLLFGKDFKVGKSRINTFGLNLKTVYRGRLRTTPIDLNKSILADRAIYLVDLTNTKRLPDVFELNFGTNYRYNGNDFAWIISADIQNLLDRQNILVYEYRGSSQQVVTVRGMGILPVVNFRIEFLPSKQEGLE